MQYRSLVLLLVTIAFTHGAHANDAPAVDQPMIAGTIETPEDYGDVSPTLRWRERDEQVPGKVIHTISFLIYHCPFPAHGGTDACLAQADAILTTPMISSSDGASTIVLDADNTADFEAFAAAMTDGADGIVGVRRNRYRNGQFDSANDTAFLEKILLQGFESHAPQSEHARSPGNHTGKFESIHIAADDFRESFDGEHTRFGAQGRIIFTMSL